jgi:hypothetical protein
MDSQTKNCQKCKKDFIIESEDFDFYEKMKVPAPTLCPDCRMQRRFALRNEWHLLRKKDIHGKEIFSMFHEDAPVKIMGVEEWYSDSWDPLEYGKDYDFSKPFFEQFKELMNQVPLMARNLVWQVNSDYCMNATAPKDCYLSFGISYVENSANSVWGSKSKDIFDCHNYNESELCYDCFDVNKCYKALYSVGCDGCSEILFCKNCVGCNNCFGCCNLKNKSYYIFNQAYSKEEYQEKIKEFKVNSRTGVEAMREKAINHWMQFPNKFIHGRHNTNVSGDYIYNSKDAKNCWRIIGAENVKYCQNFTLGPAKDSYDHSNFGSGAELIYDSLVVGDGAYNVSFSAYCYPQNSNLKYCLQCQSSSNLFGCISVRKKEYCILNKQYTKEEYEALVPKIIEHMKLTGEYGEFFPMKMSPLAYNESFAFEHFPLTKEEVQKRGLVWREPKEKNFNVTMQSNNVPDDINDVNESITSEIISCGHEGNCSHECAKVFKITQQELQFHKLLKIPLPRICQNCRHYSRFAWRNPAKLWHRKCMKPGCQNEFETSYAPDRPEIVYCEQCYNAEVA